MTPQNFLIAGGSSGIGLALARQLSAAGAQVWVLSRTGDSLASLPGVTHIPVDVTADEIDVSRLPEVLHGLAYCPGSITLKPFRSLKPANFLADYEINVLGAVKVLQAAYPALKKGAPASVLLFSTVAVGQGMPYHASIAAAKGAVEGLTRSLAAEWAPDIRVNCIAPSLTDTPMAARLLGSPEKREASAKRHPLNQVGSPEDIARIAQLLLTEAGSWITGQVIGIDGGLSTLKI